ELNFSGRSLAVDGSGNAYLVGATNSTDFPTVNAIQSTYGGGETDAFVTKLSADGSSLVFSTYLGGSGTGRLFREVAFGVAVDASGNAYVTGGTDSSNFPILNAI